MDRSIFSHNDFCVKHMLVSIFVLLTPFFAQVLLSQPVDRELLTREWPAKWICMPGSPAGDHGVSLFRKAFDLKAKPDCFIIHVSADNRYKLYVNEQLVSMGPARGDMYYWNYETVDIAPFLYAGTNIVAARVWNEGAFRPEAQISWHTGFILQGNSASESVVNKNNS